jgi:hypothetical protein
LTKDGALVYFARRQDRDACALKPKCCPNLPARKIARSVHEAGRDKARAIAKTEVYAISRRERKKVEMLVVHLKRILGLGKAAPPGTGRCERRIPVSGHRPKSSDPGEAHPPSAANLRHMMRRRASSRPPQTVAATATRPSSAEGFFNIG